MQSERRRYINHGKTKLAFVFLSEPQLFSVDWDY